MSIIVDLIIVAVVLISVLLAYKKGLISLALGLVSFAIAIVVTVVLYKPISNIVINVTSIDEMLENVIYEKANDIMIEDEGDNVSNMVMDTAKQNLLPETARIIAVNIVTGGVILILVVGVKIALRFVDALANFVAKLPIIDQINKIGGIVYGLIRGLLIIYIALLLINVAGQIKPDNIVHQNIETSYIGKIMYENNILNIFFEKK
jgi:uncharacterized membrane protein required for colicin V production